MNIQAEKLEIMKMVLETNNPSILETIKGLFKIKSSPDFWETLTQDQKNDILQGIKDVDSGDIVDYDEFMEKHR